MAVSFCKNKNLLLNKHHFLLTLLLLMTKQDLISVGRKVVGQFLSTIPESYAPAGFDGNEPAGNGRFVMYAVSSLWANALQFSRLIGDKSLQDRLTSLFQPYLKEKRALCSRMNHVDFSVFGSVPLEVYLTDSDKVALEAGLRYADHQWETPDPSDPGDCGNADYATQVGYLKEGFSPQSRFWIEDMYMITLLQTRAYLATGDLKYLERTAREMAVYLERMQLEDGLFNHCDAAPHKWGRGNGWVAGGMPLLLECLSKDNPNRPLIEEAYRKMMSALLKYQHRSGLWGQIIDDPDAWDESSCSAMFTSAFFSGLKLGLLDTEKFGPAADKALTALCSKIDTYGNIADVGAGINANPDKQAYLNHPKINGAPHGQAAMLWTVNAILSRG